MASKAKRLDPHEAALEMCRRSLLAYACLIKPKFQRPNHVKVLAQKLESALERVEKGERVYLQVMMPPQNGKSTLTAEVFISWMLGKHPDWGIAYGTYAGDFAEKRGGAIRGIVDGDLHRAVFPECVMSQDTTAKAEWALTKGGGLKSVGRGGGLTGRPFKVVVIDDPFKDQAEADSPTIRESAKDWYHGSVESRQPLLTIIINTRWHVDDLSGYTLKNLAHLNWEVVSFPAINEHGESIWPEKYPVEQLLAIKQGMPARKWAALYQQTPIVEGGNLLNPGWFRTYTTLPSARADHVVQSWDTAQKANELNDYSVCTTWHIYGNQAYLVDVLRCRLTEPELKKRIASHRIAWGADLVLLEDKSSGISLLQNLRADRVQLPLIGIDPGKESKEMRASRTSDVIEGGLVFIPAEGTKPWLTDYLMEVIAFPQSEFDDQVDSTSQFLAWFKEKLRRGAFFVRSSNAGRRSASKLLNGYL